MGTHSVSLLRPANTSLPTLPASMSECKPTSELLSAIQGADTKGLKEVTPVENTAAKHDMAMFGVERFDKSKLRNVDTEEKNVLPTAEDIKQAKALQAIDINLSLSKPSF